MINLHTEEEAKEKRCPGHMPNADCWPRTCMAWRWKENILDPDTLKEVLKYGYCGLGGKP